MLTLLLFACFFGPTEAPKQQDVAVTAAPARDGVRVPPPAASGPRPSGTSGPLPPGPPGAERSDGLRNLSLQPPPTFDPDVQTTRSLILEHQRSGSSDPLARAEALLRGRIDAGAATDEIYAALGDVRLEAALARETALAPGFAPAAEAAYAQALAVDPASASALRSLTRYHSFAGDMDAAIASIERLIAADPDGLEAQLQLGVILDARGDAEAALEVLEAARAVWRRREASGAPPPLSRLLVILERQGLIYTRLGRSEEAEAILTEAVALAEAEASRGQQKVVACPYAALGQLYKLSGRAEEGAAMYRRAADLEPTQSEIQLDAAEELYYVGEHALAIEYAERAMALRPDDRARQILAAASRALEAGVGAPPIATMAAAHRAFARYDFQAAGALAREVASEHGAATLLALVALMEADYDRAASLAATTRTSAGLIQAHLRIAEKDWGGAEAALAPSLERVERLLSDPRGRRAMKTPGAEQLEAQMALLGAGWIEANQARHEPAIERFDALLELKPADLFALIGAANSRNALGRLDEAEALLERALGVDPENPYALAELALVRLNQGDEDAAEVAFKKALEVEPTTYTCPHEGLGLVYLRQGRTDEAAAAFEQAIAINPEIEYKKFNGLAQIYIDQGRYEEARALLRRSIENYPYDDEAARMLASIEGR